MWILGLNAPPAGWHDGSACLVDERGTVVAFAEEERLVRIKHARNESPTSAARYCLAQAGITPADVDVVAVGWDMPYACRLYGGQWEFDSTPEWLCRALGWQVSWRDMPDVTFVRHHVAHATLALYASGYDAASIVVVDGNGDDEGISIFHGIQGRPVVRKRVWPMSHSLGWLYESASRFINLDFLEAGKTMGLAAYGRARGLDPWPLLTADGEDGFRPLLSIPEDYHYDLVIRAWGKLFEDHGGRAVRTPSTRLDQDDVAVMTAWSAQAALEQEICHLAEVARRVTGEPRTCLAGGVALNCAANGRVPEPLYVPPIPHDAGVALGAAWHVAPPTTTQPLSPYLGPDVTARMPGPEDVCDLTVQAVDLTQVCDAIRAGRVGAIAEGPAEVGPRALCHRSIIASPATAAMRDKVNAIKGREHWRPFGPVTLASRSTTLWEPREHLFRYMVGSVSVTELGREQIPAVVHVDGTTRPQSIPDGEESLIAEILTKGDDTMPVALINTSFNTRGVPIVASGLEAIEALRSMELDFLVLADKLYAKRLDWWR